MQLRVIKSRRDNVFWQMIRVSQLVTHGIPSGSSRAVYRTSSHSKIIAGCLRAGNASYREYGCVVVLDAGDIRNSVVYEADTKAMESMEARS